MKQRFVFTLSLLAVVLMLSGITMAQGNGQGAQRGYCKTNCYVDKNGDGVCDNFKDANNDGRCDNCTCPASCGKGKGNCCSNFVDSNNDGRCDNCQNSNAYYGNGRGKCNRRCCPVNK
ncbi:MAG: hypothetical protein ACP5UA_11845 [Candidatus Hydrogenedens sp.]